jgi:hypothetical protein
MNTITNTNTSNNINPLDIIKATKGKFVAVTYRNKKGETKHYVVRTGVTKYLSGGTKPTVPDSITVFSMSSDNPGYKTFLSEGIKQIRLKKECIYKG